MAKYDDYALYSKEALVAKILEAKAQLEHVKAWAPRALGLPLAEAMELGHAIDHALSELDGEPSPAQPNFVPAKIAPGPLVTKTGIQGNAVTSPTAQATQESGEADE